MRSHLARPSFAQLRRAFGATALLALLSPLAHADAPVTRVEVGPRVSESIPEVPESLISRLARYQNTRGAILGGFAGNDAVVVLTRFGETNQAHRVTAPLGMREQLTFFKEPVSAVAVQPGKASRGYVFGRDIGGSEFWQLYWFDFASRETVLLTTPEVPETDGKPARRTRNEYPLWSPDGKQLAWASTARNGTDSDIWVADMTSVTAGGQAAPASRPVLTEGGTWLAADFSPDGKRLLVIKFVSINEAYPGEVDLETGKLRLFPVDGGKASFTAFQYAPDGRGVYYISDEGREFLTLWFHDPKGGAPVAISKDIPWDVVKLAISPTGRHLAFSVNDDGVSKLHVRTLPGLKPVKLGVMPVGVMGALSFSADGERIAVAINGATSPSDLYVVSLKGGAVTRWTQSEVGGLDTAGFRSPELVRYPTFDTDPIASKPRTIPAFYYRPEGPGPFPVVVQIHGGPEAQAQPIFSPMVQFMLRELKIAVLIPNVRGSSGYGKRYLLLDNGLQREDSVKDIGALLDWVKTRQDLDATRVGVIGGSYGGYMVLASLTHYSDRLRAGIDIVGISHFRTFLENTESYRRDLRRAEYGDERVPEVAAFHDRIAPLTNAAKITRPLFVAQGLNDPRVPWTEAEQIVKAVRTNDVPVWYLLFKDEGHGFQKKTNADYFGAASVLFWQQHLLGP